MYNKVIMMGNLTRDVESKNLSSGSEIANFSIASSYKYKDRMGEPKEEVCFIDVSVFGRQAQTAAQYLKKGSKVLVEGRLNLEQWSDKQSGQNRSKHTIIADSFQMIGGRGDESTQTPQREQPRAPQDTQSKPIEQKQDTTNTPSIPVEISGAALIVDSIKYDIGEQKELDQLCSYLAAAKQKYPKQSLIDATNKIVAAFESNGNIMVQFDSDKILSKIDIIPF